jgi:hypothetical protein
MTPQELQQHLANIDSTLITELSVCERCLTDIQSYCTDQDIEQMLASVKRRFKFTPCKGTPYIWFLRLAQRRVPNRPHEPVKTPAGFIERDEEW